MGGDLCVVIDSMNYIELPSPAEDGEDVILWSCGDSPEFHWEVLCFVLALVAVGRVWPRSVVYSFENMIIYDELCGVSDLLCWPPPCRHCRTMRLRQRNPPGCWQVSGSYIQHAGNQENGK